MSTDCLSFFIFFPCYFIVFNIYPKEKAPKIAHRLSQLWARTLFAIFFIRVRIVNAQFIDAQKTYVFIGNHRSFLDIPAYAIACKNTIRFLAKVELTKIPLLGYVIRKTYISVDRKDKAARLQSINNMLDSLKEKISVFICPEGTRNRTERPLLDFRDGAFRLAIESQLPLAVLTVKGADKLLSPKRPLELSPGIITCIWSKPIDTLGMTMDDLETLKEKARVLMIAEL